MTYQNLGVSQKKNLKSDLNKSELIEKLKSDPVIGKIKILLPNTTTSSNKQFRNRCLLLSKKDKAELLNFLCCKRSTIKD